MMRRAASIFLIIVLAATTAAAASPNLHAQRLEDAGAVLQSVVEASEGIPKDLLEDAVCIGVFPKASKRQFETGGVFAHGMFTCRRPDGSMGAPAFFTLSTGIGTWGFPTDQADLVVLVMTDEGKQRLIAGRTSFGPSASTVSGPVGRDVSTPAQLQAAMLSWAHSGSSVSGSTLDGNVLAQDMTATETFYGSRVAAKEILLDPEMAPPKAAEAFVRTTSEYANPAS